MLLLKFRPNKESEWQEIATLVGPQGEVGPAGVSPTATIEANENGALLTVTDGNGTTSAQLYNGSTKVSLTDTDTGVLITVTDVSGEYSLEVNDGAQGPQGIQGIQGILGIQGEKGDPFTYEDFTQELLESIRGPQGIRGEKGETGSAGKDGVNGVSPTATVVGNDNGALITITDANGTTSAQVYNGSTKVTLAKTDTGVAITVTDSSGTQTLTVNDGYTPLKFVDYYTEADKQEIINAVLNSLPSAEGVSV